MSIFVLKEQERHLKRLYSQFDALQQLKTEAAAQQDRLAAEIEATRTAIEVTKLNRTIAPISPLKMRIEA
jgi:DNA-binding XRE family transcriptional regulator